MCIFLGEKAMKASFEIEQSWFMKDVFEKVEKLALKGLKKGGEFVGGEAMKEAPVLSGTLKRSICVTEGGTPNAEYVHQIAQGGSNNTNKPLVLDEAQGQELSVYVSANTPYAHKQHEQNRNHSKFLEKGLQKVQNRIPQLVEMELKKL